MSDEKRKLGFCPMCMQNVGHTRKFSFVLFDLLDLLTLRTLQIVRIGPWFCFQCERKSFFLRLPRGRVPTFDIDQSSAGFMDRSRVDEGAGRETNEPRDSVELVGNFLKSEHSLVMRGKRANKYSRKFRDAAVMRIMSGTISFSELRRELNVAESDLIDWISDLMARKQTHIEELSSVLKSVQAKMLENSQVTSKPLEMVDDECESVIQGRVTPK